MTKAAKIEMVKTLVGNDPEATDELIAAYLAVAKDAIMSRLYPFDSAQTEMPGEYDMTQCQLAVRGFLRRGAEGETVHNENGINRTYGSVNDEDLLSRVVQVVKVV
jgi:hypothetical protein